jgi:hypothetical protein
MMRRYVQQGVARDAQNFADEAEKLMKNTSVLRAVGFE